jgi:hypothetical protein
MFGGCKMHNAPKYMAGFNAVDVGGAETTVTNAQFSDDLIDLRAWARGSRIGIELTNKSDQSLKIDWDSVAYVSVTGQSQRVIHSGVRLMDRDKPQAPSVIVKRSTLTDELIPAENIYFVTGKYGGWRERGLFEREGLEGKAVHLLLPVQTEGQTVEYMLRFDLAPAVKKEGAPPRAGF